jgi:hypothetical protein
MLQERKRIRVPAGLSQTQVPAFERRVRDRIGKEFRLESIDLDSRQASFIRTVDVSTVQAIEGSSRMLEVQLPDSWATPSSGDKASASFSEQYPGYSLLRFEPHVKRAILAQITADVLTTRAAVAEALGVKPWDVEVKKRRGGGYVLTRLPSRYTPSKHDSKLREVAETKVPGGHPGWFCRIDGQRLTGEIIPSELPTFPSLIPTDMGRLGREPNRTVFGMALPLPGEKVGEPAVIDWTASPAALIGGTPGSGKRQPLYARIPVPVSDRFPTGWATMGELRVGDEVYTPGGVVTAVEWLSPIVTRPTWRLRFADGQTVDSDADHLWPVSTFASRSGNAFSTTVRDKTIRQRVIDHEDDLLDVFDLAVMFGVRLDVVRAAVTDQKIPIHRGGTIRVGDLSAVLLPDDLQDCTPGSRVFPTASTADVAADILGARMKGYAVPVAQAIKGAPLPFVDSRAVADDVLDGTPLPAAVLRSSIPQRRRVLSQVARRCGRNAGYGEVTLKLPTRECAESVLELVRSLGVWATARERSVSFTPPFKLGANLGTVRVQRWNRIVDATYLGLTPGRCLRVADTGHLYLTGGFIPTHNTVTLNALLADQIASGAECVVVDTPDKSVDFLWAKPYLREGGWGCDSARAAVTALAMVYQEGAKRANVLAESGYVKWLDMPPQTRFKPIYVVVDEYSALTVPDPMPKGIPKDSLVYLEIAEINYQKAMISHYIRKIIAERRNVGVLVVLSTQVTNASTGVAPSLKATIGHKILQGSNPSPAARKQAFNDDSGVPTIPDNIAGAGVIAKGVGAAELEGVTPFVYKSVFATTDEYRAELERRGIPHCSQPEPTASQIARFAPALEDELPDDRPRTSKRDQAGFGDPGGHPALLKGAAKANHDRAVEMAQASVTRKPARDARLRSPDEAAHRLNASSEQA